VSVVSWVFLIAPNLGDASLGTAASWRSPIRSATCCCSRWPPACSSPAAPHRAPTGCRRSACSRATAATSSGSSWRAARPTTRRAIIDRLRALTPEGETTSAGIAGWDGAESADALVARADHALHRAKRGGRDRTVVASDPAPVAPRSAARGEPVDEALKLGRLA
jgi:hypothetical protein